MSIFKNMKKRIDKHSGYRCVYAPKTEDPLSVDKVRVYFNGHEVAEFSNVHLYDHIMNFGELRYFRRWGLHVSKKVAKGTYPNEMPWINTNLNTQRY